MMNRNKILVWLGIGAACTACCAPLVAALWAGGASAGLFAAGGLLAGISFDLIVCGILGVGLLAGLAIWLVRRRARGAATS
jgi:hypothetical protein